MTGPLAPPPAATGRAVLDAVVAVFSVPELHIRSERLDQPTVRARQALYFVLREHLAWTFGRIGRFLSRDKTSCRTGYLEAKRLRCFDFPFATRVREVLILVGL
jgi:chromosomal replication initiation ATPase DnaA